MSGRNDNVLLYRFFNLPYCIDGSGLFIFRVFSLWCVFYLNIFLLFRRENGALPFEQGGGPDYYMFLSFCPECRIRIRLRSVQIKERQMIVYRFSSRGYKVFVHLKAIRILICYIVMIIDSLENAARIESLHPLFKRVFDYLRSVDLSLIEEGKFYLQNGDVIFSTATIPGKEKCRVALETHHKYIDIQLPINTTEIYGWRPLSELSKLSSPYDIDRDITFFEDRPSVFFAVDPGNFVVFFPEDAHAPGIGNRDIKKIVIKVKV